MNNAATPAQGQGLAVDIATIHDWLGRTVLTLLVLASRTSLIVGRDLTIQSRAGHSRNAIGPSVMKTLVFAAHLRHTVAARL